MRTTCIIILAASLAACDLDVPDLNNPPLGDLTDNPTVGSVNAACTGLIVGNRRNHAAANGYVVQLAILGREAYNFDTADPRFITELLTSSLNAGSPFGGNFWTAPYANIRLAYTVITAVEKVADYSAAEKAAIRGYAKTMIALDLLEVINTRDDIGAVIDVDHPLDAPLGPIADKPEVLAEIAKKLDEGATELAMGGDAFSFNVSSGFAGFDTPMTFRTFNRAMKARVAVYQKDYAAALTALGESFIKAPAATQADLDIGVYYSYSTGAGDATNAMIAPSIFAHPSIASGVQMNGAANDLRFTRKTTMATAGSSHGLTSNIAFTLYDRPDAPVAMIRNEELLLLRAEAKFLSTPSDAMGAMVDLNMVRTVSGGLPQVAGTPAMDAFITALLYERQYSLLMEGHRLIDVRRFDRIDSLPLDVPSDPDEPAHKRNRRYPVPLPECNARTGEPKCELTSL
jgi:starch-binding outer membrane protein, SusD/RagB family